jgi:hypothetical protein
MASPPNPAVVPAVTYDYLFYLPSSEQPSHLLDVRHEGYYQGHVPQVPHAVGYGPKNLDMTRLPIATNISGSIHPVPDMVLPVQLEGEGPPSKKEINMSPVRTSPFSHLGGHGQARFHYMSAHCSSSL